MTGRPIIFAILLIFLCGCKEHKTEILVFDYGSPSTPKIAKNLDRLKIKYMVTKDHMTAEQIAEINPKGIITSGSPASVTEKDYPKPTPEIYDMGIPILGICYGMQLMGAQLGGKVGHCKKAEKGIFPVIITGKCDILPDNMKELKAWHFHNDCVESLPAGFEIVGHTQNTKLAIACNPEKKLYGVQFHPERFDKSQEATVIIDRFVAIALGQ